MRKFKNQYLTETQFSNLKRKMPEGFNPDNWEVLEFRTHLKKWRLENGIETTHQLSKLLHEHGFNFGAPFIGEIENGKKSPPRDFMYALCFVFDASIDDIFFSDAHLNHLFEKEFIGISEDYAATIKACLDFPEEYLNLIREVHTLGITPEDLKEVMELVDYFKSQKEKL